MPRTTLTLAPIIITVLAATAACQPVELPELRTGHRVSATCPPVRPLPPALPPASNTAEKMFPSGFRYGPAQPTEDIANMLRDFGGVPLWCGDGPAEVYRLSYNRGMRASMVVERTRADQAWRLRGVVLDRVAEPNSLLNPRFTVRERAERAVATTEAEAIVTHLEGSGLWGLSPYDPIGSTGGEWVIEARNNGAYQFLRRTSGPDDALRDATVRLVALAGLDFRR